MSGATGTVPGGTPHEAPPSLRKPLIGIAVMLTLVLTAVTVSRLNGPAASNYSTARVVIDRTFRFVDQPDRSVAVFDAQSGQQVATVPPVSGSFIRGVLRSLVRERKLDAIGSTPPFRLVELADGHVVLSDPATQTEIDLGAFGETNLATFLPLLTATPGSGTVAGGKVGGALP